MSERHVTWPSPSCSCRGAAVERRTWRNLEDLPSGLGVRLEDDPEFPAAFALPETSRRDVLRVLAASLLTGALPACDGSTSADEAVPYVRQPEHTVPGEPRRFATATLLDGYAQPVVVTTHEGRPTKIEGNPDHPIGNGGTDTFMQAAVLQFYDPDRSPTITYLGQIATWASFERQFVGLRQRFDETRGRGLRLLSGTVTSPTLSRQLDRLIERWPEARWHCFEPVGSELRNQALELAFGRPLAMHHRLAQADAIVAFDDDLLGAGPEQLRNAGGWARRRRAMLAGDGEADLFVAEPTPTLTGAMARARLPIEARRIPALAAALAGHIGLSPRGAAGELTAEESRWLDAAATALRRHSGRSLLAIGVHQPPALQALAIEANRALGNETASVFYTEPIAWKVAPEQTLAALAGDMANGSVETLIVLDANPVYTAPVDIDFAALLQRVPLRLHAGLFYDETAAHSNWHLPLAHPLESWSDARAVDGTASIIQPTIRPLYGGSSVHEVLALLLAEPPFEAQSIVRETWKTRLQSAGAEDAAQEQAWRAILRAGFVADSAAVVRTPGSRLAAVPLSVPAAAEAGALEVLFRPDPAVWDGRFANCAWLQELPKPLSKLTWDNAVSVSPALAQRLELNNGDLVAITADSDRLQAPVWIEPGQAENSVTVYLGYGRSRAGRIADGIGYDAYRLRRADAPWSRQGAQLAKVGHGLALTSTQTHHTMLGQDIVRVVGAEAARGTPRLSAEEPRQPSLYSVPPGQENAWAMAIDLDLCIGCNACVVACQAENNVPSVGKEQVALGREMHWLRVDRYYAGAPENPEMYFMPVPCMHCEKAPCEVGCPVNATVHGQGGLNQMVYNRCIGTRTCSSYCPYKVRRFNWFDYTHGAAPSIEAQRNPDVTVRARGVMEKCTFCVQRIMKARIAADIDNRPIRDGEVVPACQAACPTSAIAFGDLNDPESNVTRWKKAPRNYALLEHLGTRPRTTYLARIADDKGGV